MDELLGAVMAFPLIGFVVWCFIEAARGVKSIGRTGKAIGEWNKKQLDNKEK